ncbi:conserved hypothetical protein [Ricinus communis]|uniref:DUF223 domain-containing protein n=1 Tax=Ricinus communis TaxID=3988 RepID=B9RMX0_RICCO|nr:conserved hypothetical protein [Ricinus communis]
MSYTLLSEVDHMSRNIRLKVRVKRIWRFLNIFNPDELFSLEFLMLDKKGETI